MSERVVTSHNGPVTKSNGGQPFVILISEIPTLAENWPTKELFGPLKPTYETQVHETQVPGTWNSSNQVADGFARQNSANSNANHRPD